MFIISYWHSILVRIHIYFISIWLNFTRYIYFPKQDSVIEMNW